MKRRDFLKISALSVSAAAIAGSTFGSLKNLYAGTKKGSSSFTFEILTDDPQKALKVSQEFFRNNSFDSSIIKYSEFQLDGEMPGDIVFVNNKELINYKYGSDKIRKEIRNIAGILSLPKKVTNPVRMRFRLSENNSPAENFLVFHKNKLINSYKSGSSVSNMNLKGTKGNLLMNINNGKARIISADCTHKTCVNTGSISFSGESIVCIPNEVMILCE
jgi:hypothetical protein